MFLTIIAAGAVGRDPEQRFTPSGQAVTSFSMATNRQYTAPSGETVKETTWLRVTCWGKLAEVVSQYVKKGSKVLIEGTLKPDPATGSPKIYKKSDGTDGTSYEVTAQTVRFLSSRDESGHAQTGGEFAQPEADIPF
jgi:single-strand DNA-binding protein